MPLVNPIDIRAIFEKASGHKIPEPKPITAYILPTPTIAGNLNTK